MKLEGNCQTTAMGIMPHTDVEKALELALTLDIPYWPQLPKVNFFEDMYAQVSEHFPGIILDVDKRVELCLRLGSVDMKLLIPRFPQRHLFLQVFDLAIDRVLFCRVYVLTEIL